MAHADNRTLQRPRYIFINKTNGHAHDLAFKMSLKMAETKSGIENALILLDQLPDNQSIEETAVKLFDKWKIGQDRQGRGILYLYSEKENQFKIEVSYALEGIFPDGVCHRLEEGARTYMLSEIPQDFLSELIITMNIHGTELKTDLDGNSSDLSWYPTRFLSGGAGVVSKGYRPTLADYKKAIQMVNVTERKGYEPSKNPDETIERYMNSLSKGFGDPQLPLLTEGSKLFRMIVPRNAAQQRRVLAYYQKAMPYELTQIGGMAVAVFKPGVANLPIVLRQSKSGDWFVDEPKAWTYFHRFESEVNFYPKYDDVPLNDGLIRAQYPTAFQPIFRHRAKTPRPPDYPYSLEDKIRQLENQIQNSPRNEQPLVDLGEIYLFEINWISRAIDCFSRAAAIDPDRLDVRWRLYELYMNNSEPEKMLTQLEYIANKMPNDAEVQRWWPYYRDAYRLNPGEFFE